MKSGAVSPQAAASLFERHHTDFGAMCKIQLRALTCLVTGWNYLNLVVPSKLADGMTT